MAAVLFRRSSSSSCLHPRFTSIFAAHSSNLADRVAGRFPSPRRILRSLGKNSSVPVHFQRDAVAFRRIIEQRKWDSKLEHALRQSAIPLSDGLVVEVIKALSEAKLALRFFVWVGELDNFKPSSNAVGVLSRRWCHEKQFDNFLKSLDSARHGYHSMSSESLLVLITGYGWAGMVDKAVETVEIMRNLSIRLDASHFICLLNILVREEHFDVVPKIHGQMLQTGFVPDVHTYKTLIPGLCTAGHMDYAYILVEEMHERGLTLDTETYSMLLTVLSRAGRGLEVLKIFSELLTNGIEPDATACNSLVSTLCMANQIREAYEILEGMIARSHNLNLVSLTTVIDGLCVLGEVDKAFMLWKKLNKDSTPTLTFHDSLVNELCNAGKMGPAEEVFEELGKRNAVPSKLMYIALIRGFCKSGNISKACGYLLQMPKKFCLPDMKTCNVVLSELCKDGNMVDTSRVFHHMAQRGAIIDRSVYHTLLAGFCKADNFEEVNNILGWMKKSSISLDTDTYHLVINSFCKASRLTEASSLLQEMIEDGLTPDVSLHDKLIDDLRIFDVRKECGTAEMLNDVAAGG